MMTNLIAAITVSVVTNWTTVAVISPDYSPYQHGNNMCAIYLTTEYIQDGVVEELTTAIIDWKGKKVEAVLERKRLRNERRSVHR